MEKILNKKSKIIENGNIAIDADELKANEIEILEENGYTVKLFNHMWVQKPYYLIKKN